MKRILLILALLLTTECFSQQVKVACIGNSITFGATIDNREQNSYPAQLQAILGEEYQVRNFGVNGTTALNNGLYAYTKTSAYKESQEFAPDIVLIKLGTNDANGRNDKYRKDFGKDYRAIVDSYINLPSKPRVILLTPVRCFLQSDQGQVIEREIMPTIHQTAYERGLEVINLHNLFGNNWSHTYMPDRLHPSSIGAGIMAQKIFYHLSVVPSKKGDIVERFPLKPLKEFNFHGFKGYEYNNEGVKYYIVEPHTTAEGNPWIWRARFWGHEPQTDIDLLERGFHLTYCDVADLYGSPKAIERWDTFYKLARKAGLSKKVALEGMSRGGLIIYNWAAENPSKVACIYGDAPVMDIKSWPMGDGKYRGDAHCISTMLKAYGFTSEAQAREWKGNPIDHAEKLAKAKIPILNVVGDADIIVPYDENSAIFESRIAQYGYTIEVIHKAGVGHHPHSLNNPKRIVDFILKATGRWDNPCLRPIPGNEFRDGAGWGKGNDWHSAARDIEQTLQGRDIKLLMLGNSITQGLGGNREKVVHKAGKAAMDKALGENVWECAGISGDRTQHLLWRLENGNYNRATPDVAVIAIGINNLTIGDKPKDVTEGIIACARLAREQMPSTRIILLGVLPAGLQADHPTRKQCDEVHSLLAKTKIKGVEYINPTAWFTLQDGTIRKELFLGDCLHLNEQGYEVWSQRIAELLKK